MRTTEDPSESSFSTLAPRHSKFDLPLFHRLLPYPTHYFFQVKKGDRIAQLLLEKIITPPVLEVDDLDSTERGAGGFGSTGK